MKDCIFTFNSYISGSLYNQVNPSLAHLPKEDHITALSARTINERNNQSNTQGNTTPHNTQVSIEQGSNEKTIHNLSTITSLKLFTIIKILLH